MWHLRVLDEVDAEEQPSGSAWEHPSLWRIIEHPSSAHLLQQLEDKNERQGQSVQHSNQYKVASFTSTCHVNIDSISLHITAHNSTSRICQAWMRAEYKDI